MGEWRSRGMSAYRVRLPAVISSARKIRIQKSKEHSIGAPQITGRSDPLWEASPPLLKRGARRGMCLAPLTQLDSICSIYRFRRQVFYKVEGLRRGAHEGLLSGAMMAPFCASRERLREARWGCCPAEMRFAGAGGVLKHLRAGGRPATGNCKRTLCRHQRERAVASLDRAIADPQIKWRRVLPTYERRSARRR